MIRAGILKYKNNKLLKDDEASFPETLDDLENGDLYNLHWHANNRLGISLDEDGYYVIKPVEITLENVSEVMEDKIMLKETYDKIWKL
jgi:hypothetical protein